MQIKAKRIDDTKNSDMVILSDMTGSLFAITHIDLFWEGHQKSPISISLESGEEVTLNVTLAEVD